MAEFRAVTSRDPDGVVVGVTILSTDGDPVGGVLQLHDKVEDLEPGFLAWFGEPELRRHPLTVRANAFFWAWGPTIREALSSLKNKCCDYQLGRRYERAPEEPGGSRGPPIAGKRQKRDTAPGGVERSRRGAGATTEAQPQLPLGPPLVGASNGRLAD